MPEQLAPGATVGPFQIVARLGAGGMGEVFHARDDRLNRELALKLLPSFLGDEERAIDRFTREARAASALNHPNIVTIYEIGESPYGRYIAMELVRGRTFSAFLSGTSPIDQCAGMTAQCAEALAVAHDAGIVHRDVKPDNLMVREDGYVKVLDFGLARLMRAGERTSEGGSPAPTPDNQTLTHPGLVLGTIRYMSPEQACGDLVGSATDVFALGLVLYEMLTASHPFAGASSVATMSAIISKEAAPVSSKRADVPPELSALVDRMLSKEPEGRPTAAAARDELVALSGATAARTRGTRQSQVQVPVVTPPASHSGRDRTRMVGRTNDGSRVVNAFHEATAGRGSMLCVAGEPGIGKTTLVEACLSRISRDHPGVNIARGRCSERLAGTEAYLPVLDALEGALRGELGEAVRARMRQFAPTWYTHMVGESGERSAESSVSDLKAVSQEKMKREIVALLTAASRESPVILFLDDLHWADSSTIDLLAYIGTRLDGMRVLVLVTYRASEMRLSKHPFLQVQLDLQSRGVASELALDFLTLEHVREYLDLQYPNHLFASDFARALHAKTEGNPLFLVDVLRFLGAQGVIAESEGHWRLVRSVPDIERELPESVRSMIQRKIEQLGESDRRLLAAASVQGAEFDSAVVAAALGIDPADVEEQLITLERVYVLVRRIEEVQYPDRAFTVRYRFVHVLYQNSLYSGLTASRRASHSAKVAQELEKHYADDVSEVASQLAVLYEGARDAARSAHYYTIAAQRAVQVFAFAEADALARRGLAQVSSLREGPERTGLELGLRVSLGFTNLTRKGFADRETGELMDRARELCHQIGEVPPLMPALFGLCLYHIASGQPQAGYDDGVRLKRIAEGAGDPMYTMVAEASLGGGLLHTGRPAESIEHFAECELAFDPLRRDEYRKLLASDPYLMASNQAVRTLLILGRYDEARKLMDHTVRLARVTRDPRDRAFTALFVTEISAIVGDAEAADRAAAEGIKLCEDYGIASEHLWLTAHRGWALSRLGKHEEGLQLLDGAIGILTAIQCLVLMPYMHSFRAEALVALGRYEEAIAAANDGLATAERTGEHTWDAELLRILGDAHAPDAEAESYYRRAMDVAASQRALAFELRSALALAKLWTIQGRRDEAVHLVHGVYDRFGDWSAADVVDLRAARAILAGNPLHTSNTAPTRA